MLFAYTEKKIMYYVMSCYLGEVADLAKTFSALVLAVEHRFYGKSVPDVGTEIKHLQYATTKQV